MGAEADLVRKIVSDTSIVIRWRRQICRARHEGQVRSDSDTGSQERSNLIGHGSLFVLACR